MVFVDVSLSFFFSKKESDAALVAVWKRDINNYKGTYKPVINHRSK
jgi:hypothetical protein